MLKKIITLSLLCAVLCTALLLSSCSNSQNDDIPDNTPSSDTATTTDAQTTEAPGPDYSDKLVIVLDGKTQYSIIRAENAQDRVVKAGAALLTGIKEATATAPTLGTDWAGKLVKRVDMTLLGIEPENISLIEGEFIIGCNNASWTGGEVYSLEIVKKN